MEKYSMILKFNFLFLVIYFTIFPATGNPVHIVTHLKIDNDYEYSNTSNSSRRLNNMPDCKEDEFAVEDVIFRNNSDIFVKSMNITVQSSDYHRNGEKVYICLSTHYNNSNKLIANCKDRFVYKSNEFEILPNRSALVFGEIIVPEEFMLRDGTLLICAVENILDEPGNNTFTSVEWNLSEASIYVGKIGSGISIFFLIIHLLIFCYIPTLKNLPGYNLASLSVAFLFAYSFMIIGQIKEVLGLFCVVSAILQQNFFLVAFFCMNVMAFDVWKTLKLSTQKFIVGSTNVRKRQFIWYSLYAWGCPFIISTISVLIDNLQGIPDQYRPHYGRNDTCWMTNMLAKIIFFTVPALTLCIINALFFISSAVMIYTNTMKCTNDQQKQTVQVNYILYVRLGIMMGLTWLLGVIAMISESEVVWFIQDFFNSLQGLFLFLLFTCTRKVAKHIRERANSISRSSEKHSTLSKISGSKMESQ